MSLKLPASMRTKRRYLRIQGGTKEVIERALLQGLGTLGWARAAPLFVTVPALPGIVLSVDRRYLNDVRAALELAPERITVTRVSGTLKGLENPL